MTHGKGMQSYLCMMAVRLLEMKRVLKDTGSIYCIVILRRATISSWLWTRCLERGTFVTKLSWKNGDQILAKTPTCGDDFLLIHRDIILRFSQMGNSHFTHKVYVPHDPSYVARAYKYLDEDGRKLQATTIYSTQIMTAPKVLTYEFLGVTRVWRYRPASACRKLMRMGLSYSSSRERYLSTNT